MYAALHPTVRPHPIRDAMTPLTLLDDEDIVVRPLHMDEADALCEAVVASSAEIAPWQSWCTPDFAAREARAFLQSSLQERARRRAFDFGIVERTTGAILGVVSINGIDDEHRVGNLGYWVRSTVAGHGLATRVAHRVARFGFFELDLNRIEIVAATGNRASCRVAEKLGARHECVARHRLMLHGQAIDAHVYALLPDDLKA
jgi:RimJ/RimL family protein N-acetyltransferase